MKRTKRFLEQISEIDTKIKNKLIEIEQWKEIALCCSSGGTSVLVKVKGKTELHNMEKVQSSPNPQKMADAVCEYVTIEQSEIQLQIEKLKEAKKDVLEVIEQLNTTEYDVLHKVYVQHLTFYDVADIMKKSYSWVTTVHGRALKNVKTILDERDQRKEDKK